MIKKLTSNLAAVFIALFTSTSTQAAVVSISLTDFSSNIGVDAITWDAANKIWSGTQVVGGLYNDGTGPFDLTSALSTGVSNSAGLQAQVTATLNSSVPAGSFRITLENQAAQIIFADFNWSDFLVGSSATVTKSFQAALPVSLASWDRSSVGSWNLVSSGNGASVNALFSNLSVIPEPSSLSMLGIGLAALIACRRRKS